MAILAAGALGLTSALAFGHSGSSSNGVAICGLDRWAVKTLQDRPHLLSPRWASVVYLVSRRPPAALPPRRLAFERHVFRVAAAVRVVRQEADGDLHLVLRDGRHTMIAEAPKASCDEHASRIARTQMSHARATVRTCARAIITGVAFFDFNHGQTGVAPNAIELHPVLDFTCRST